MYAFNKELTDGLLVFKLWCRDCGQVSNENLIGRQVSVGAVHGTISFSHRLYGVLPLLKLVRSLLQG